MSEEAKRLRELDIENVRLLRLLAEAELDKAILEEANRGNVLIPIQKRETIQRVQQSLSVSERRACKALEFSRSSIRYVLTERRRI